MIRALTSAPRTMESGSTMPCSGRTNRTRLPGTVAKNGMTYAREPSELTASTHPNSRTRAETPHARGSGPVDLAGRRRPHPTPPRPAAGRGPPPPLGEAGRARPTHPRPSPPGEGPAVETRQWQAGQHRPQLFGVDPAVVQAAVHRFVPTPMLGQQRQVHRRLHRTVRTPGDPHTASNSSNNSSCRAVRHS
jgi:hypothetical protein